MKNILFASLILALPLHAFAFVGDLFQKVEELVEIIKTPIQVNPEQDESKQIEPKQVPETSAVITKGSSEELPTNRSDQGFNSFWLKGNWCLSNNNGVVNPTVRRVILPNPSDITPNSGLFTSAIYFENQKWVSEKSSLVQIESDIYEIQSNYNVELRRGLWAPVKEIFKFRVDDNYETRSDSLLRKLMILEWTQISNEDVNKWKFLEGQDKVFFASCESFRTNLPESEFETIKSALGQYRGKTSIKNVALFDSPPSACAGTPFGSACTYKDSLLQEDVLFEIEMEYGLVQSFLIKQSPSLNKDALGNAAVDIKDFDSYVNDLVKVLIRNFGDFTRSEKERVSYIEMVRKSLLSEGMKICSSKSNNPLDNRQICESKLQTGLVELEGRMKRVCGRCEVDVYAFTWIQDDFKVLLTANVGAVKSHPTSLNSFQLLVGAGPEAQANYLKLVRSGVQSREHRLKGDALLLLNRKKEDEETKVRSEQRLKDF